MNKILAAAAVAALAALTACSANPAPPAPTPTPSESVATGPASPSESSATAVAGGAKAACELFNSLFAEYAAVPDGDVNGYEDVYLKSQEAKKTVSGDLRGLFAALSVIAIDHASAAETGGGPEQASKDAIRDAFFANAGTCTAAGVTLRL